MKYVTSLALILSCLNAYAMDVRVFFNNRSPERLKPLAVVNYVKQGVEYEEYIKPPITFIEPFTEHVKFDQDRLNLDSYIMVWFEMNDENDHYRHACLESYYALSRSADIYFTLEPDDDIPGRYMCNAKTVLR